MYMLKTEPGLSLSTVHTRISIPFLNTCTSFKRYMDICHGSCNKWMVYIDLSILMDNITCAEILWFLQSKVHKTFVPELGFLRNFAWPRFCTCSISFTYLRIPPPPPPPPLLSNWHCVNTLHRLCVNRFVWSLRLAPSITLLFCRTVPL